MKFYKLIKDILNTLRMEKAEFQRLTGINPVNITWWEQHPDTLPQMKTIKRIEQGLGIVFDFDEDGRPVNWQKSDQVPGTETSPLIGMHSKEKVVGSSLGKPQNTSGITIPSQPSEIYDQFEFYGEKPEWAELSANEQKFYENLYQLFLVELDEANASYQKQLDQATVSRAHSIEDAKSKIRRAILNKLMGEVDINTSSPF